MSKFSELLNQKRIQLLPLLVVIVCIGIWYVIDTTSLVGNLCNHTCSEAIWAPLSTFALFFLPGAFSLLLVRRKVLGMWSIFLLIYLVGTYFILSSQSYWGSWTGNDRTFYAGELGLAFSVITILWSIIHTLIIRHGEKKGGTQS